MGNALLGSARPWLLHLLRPRLAAVRGLTLPGHLGAQPPPWGALCARSATPNSRRFRWPCPPQVVMTSHEQSLAKPLLIPPSERGTLLRWPALLRTLSGEGSCPCSLQDEEFSSGSGSASTRLAYNTAP